MSRAPASLLTWVSALLVLLPAAALGVLGFQAAFAGDQSRLAEMRRTLGVARGAYETRLAAGLHARETALAASLVDAAEAIAAAAPDLGLGEAVARAYPDMPEVLGLSVTAADSRVLHPRVFDADTSAGRGEGDPLAALRAEVDRLRYGESDLEGAREIWRAAAETLPGAALRAQAELELLRLLPPEERRDAMADRLAAEGVGLLEHGRPGALLLLLAADEDVDGARDLMALAEVQRALEAVPLTPAERSRAAALSGDTPATDAVLETPLAGGTVLRARYARRRLVAPTLQGLGQEASARVPDARLLAWRAGEPLPEPDEATRAWLADGRALDVQVDLPPPVDLPPEVSGVAIASLPVRLRIAHGDADRLEAEARTRRVWMFVGISGLLLLTVLGLRLSRRAIARERDAVRVREEFIATVSHELRTPLTAMRMRAEMLGEGDLPAEVQREHIEVVRKEGERLVRLVEDLLDFSKAEGGVPEVAPLDLSAVVYDVAQDFEAQALAAGVTFFQEIGWGVEAMGEAQGLRRVLANLLDNALKHGTPSRDGSPGRIWLKVLVVGGRPTVQVEDDGPGIPAELRAKIFERFERAPAAANRPGMGLGLAIARELVEGMDGALDCAITTRGTQFRVVLKAPTTFELDPLA